MPTYRYCGDEPTVFVDLQKDGHTWAPSNGEEITSKVEIAHPLLELVVPAKTKADTTAAKTDKQEAPAEPVADESPEATDDSQEETK